MSYQLTRRLFLQGIGAAALSQSLLGCNTAKTIPQVLFLEKSIPPQSIGSFRKVVKNTQKINFKPQTQIAQIFEFILDLQQTNQLASTDKNYLEKIFNKSVFVPNLVTLGDAWLTTAIKRNSIQPLSVKNLTNWQKLPPVWQKLVMRDRQGKLASAGKVYGAPYRWGNTVMAYRSDKLEKLNLVPTDWQDLWSLELRDRISLLDSPREVIGMTLKKLGKSYNSSNLNSIPELEAELLALQQQVKLYSSEHYLEPLILGDTWVAMARSADILPVLQRYPEIKLAIPQSGTSLWADLWVMPRLASIGTSGGTEKDAGSSAIESWLDYCWSAKAASQISLFTNGISPILDTLQPKDIPSDLQQDEFINSASAHLKRDEFILPLDPETEGQYRDLWLKMRQSS